MKNNKKTSNDLQTLHRKLKIDTSLTNTGGELIPITSTVVISNSVHVEVYSIQHPVSSTNKTDHGHAITEISWR
jgi:hypothetical protein